MRYHFIESNRARWPLSVMCRVLEVSRQGYYAWINRGPSERAIRSLTLLGKIRDIYQANHCRYGSRRITIALRQSGERVSYKMVEKIMRRAGLRAKGGRRFRATTDSSQTLKPAPNLLKQKFVIRTLDRVWISDFTELPCRRGKAYAVAIMDLCSRRILAIRVATTMTTQLLLKALDDACRGRDIRQKKRTIFHSDRGTQYNACLFRNELKKRGIRQSMSRKGNCYDNAPMESFWARMKVELGMPLLFNDVDETRRILRNYVHIFYNRVRIHSGIMNMSPVKFEEQLLLHKRG